MCGVSYHVQPHLQEKYHLHDTCGVHNLHAMPSVVGAIASVILAGQKERTDRDLAINSVALQGGLWWRQFVGIFVCIAFALITGTLVGFLLSFLGQVRRPLSGTYEFTHFHDNSWWEVADDYGRCWHTELNRSIPLSLQNDESKGSANATAHDCYSHHDCHGRRGVVRSSTANPIHLSHGVSLGGSERGPDGKESCV